jgi:hypothetical protein
MPAYEVAVPTLNATVVPATTPRYSTEYFVTNLSAAAAAVFMWRQSAHPRVLRC